MVDFSKKLIQTGSQFHLKYSNFIIYMQNTVIYNIVLGIISEDLIQSMYMCRHEIV